MTRFKSARFRKLLEELSADPKIRAALDKISDKSKLGQHVRALRDFLPFIAKFSKFGGKRTALISQHISLIILLFELSILLKTNVFDRPEVQKFFKENWGLLQKKIAAMYIFCSNYVRSRLNKSR